MSRALQGFVTKDFPFARNSMGASNRAKCSSVASPSTCTWYVRVCPRSGSSMRVFKRLSLVNSSRPSLSASSRPMG